MLFKFSSPLPVVFFSVCVFPCQADDTVCDHSGGSNVDSRNFPTTPGDTVINGRSDGSSDPCIIGGSQSSLNYPNGLTIHSKGTKLIFIDNHAVVKNGLTVDDGGSGKGKVTMYARRTTEIAGDVDIINGATLELITHNTASSTTRLRTREAYVNIEKGSRLLVEFNLDSTTGQYIALGALQGEGDIELSNIGQTGRYGEIFIQNGDGKTYTYSGNITYADQGAPKLLKYGPGTFIFDGSVHKASGGTPGFTDGFGLIDVSEGTLQTTSEAFIYGTRVQIESAGTLVIDQDFDGDIRGAKVEGFGDLVKRGSGEVVFGGIGSFYRGDAVIEEGTLGLEGGATLSDAASVWVQSGAALDISRVYTDTEVSRLYGTGTVNLGSKELSKIIQLSAGDPNGGIGVLNFTGSGVLDLNGTKLTVDMDPTQSLMPQPGVTHDFIQTTGSVTSNVDPLVFLVDKQAAGSPSAFLGGREFTVLRAGSGLKSIDPLSVREDSASFHAFVGADPEQTTITDTEVKVKFGIKTANQVATTVAQTPTTSTPQGGSTPKGTPSSSKNKHSAAQQHIKHHLGISGNQKPTVAQLVTNPGVQNLTTGGLANMSGQNNPEAYSSNLTLGIEAADVVAEMAATQADKSRLAPVGAEQRVWFDSAYIDAGVDGKSNLTGDYDYSLLAFVAGMDVVSSEAATTGAFISTVRVEMDEHDHIDQELESDFFYLGVYDNRVVNNEIQLSSIAALFYGSTDSKRMNYDGLGNSAGDSKADFDSYGFVLGSEVSKRYALEESFTVRPSGGVFWTYLHQDSIEEKGAGAAYDYEIDSADAHGLLLSAGADLEYRKKQHWGEFLASLGCRYEYDVYAEHNEAHSISANLRGNSSNTFVGQNRGPHGLKLGLSVDTLIGEQVRVAAGYQYSWRSHGEESHIGASCSVFW